MRSTPKSKRKRKVKKTQVQLELERFYKIRKDHEIFLAQLRDIINFDHANTLQLFINNQWRIVFPEKEFPQKGETLQKLKVALQYGIVDNAHKLHGIKTTQKFNQCFSKAIQYLNTDEIGRGIERIEGYNELSKKIIYPLNEGVPEMAKKLKKKKEKKLKEKKKNTAAPKKEKEKQKTETRTPLSKQVKCFFKNKRGANASANIKGKETTVLTGSKIATKDSPSIPESVKALRTKLIKDGIIKKNIFVKDYVFKSPSSSGAIISGSSINGWDAWKTKDGTKLMNINKK